MSVFSFPRVSRIGLGLALSLFSAPAIASDWTVVDRGIGRVEQEYSQATLVFLGTHADPSWQLLIETLMDLSRFPQGSLQPVIEFDFREAPPATLETCTVVSTSDGLIQCDLDELDAMDVAKATRMTFKMAGLDLDISTSGSFRTITELSRDGGANEEELSRIAAAATARRGGPAGASGAASSVAAGSGPVLTVNDPTDGWLNMREGPGTGHAVVKRLDNGTQVRQVGSSGNWRQVTDPSGTTGWTYAPYMRDSSGRQAGGSGAGPGSGSIAAGSSSSGSSSPGSSGPPIDEYYTPTCSNRPIHIVAKSRSCATAMRRYAEVAGCNKIDEMEAAQSAYYSQCANEMYQ